MPGPPVTQPIPGPAAFRETGHAAWQSQAAVLLNLEEDHLDRHGTFDAYRAAKLRIFANQEEDDLAVVPPGVEVSHIAARTVRFGAARSAGR